MTATPINQTDVVAENNNQQLSIREKIGYGLGDAGGTVITCLIMNFLTFFYTDTFGLTPRTCRHAIYRSTHHRCRVRPTDGHSR